MKDIPPQSADALARLHFLQGNWHCTQYSSSNDPKFGAPYNVHLTYTFLPGGYWLREDTAFAPGETAAHSQLWNHALYVGRNDEYQGRADWTSRPLEVYVVGDVDGVPGAGPSYAGWVGSDFKIFDQWGGVVTLTETSPRSIEWRYQPKENAHLIYYPNRLRKCTR